MECSEMEEVKLNIFMAFQDEILALSPECSNEIVINCILQFIINIGKIGIPMDDYLFSSYCMSVADRMYESSWNELYIDNPQWINCYMHC